MSDSEVLEFVEKEKRTAIADVLDFRRENLKRFVNANGGVKSVSLRLGYANASFLVQMIGPNPTRPITEKSARKFEEKLELAEGFLDAPLLNCKHLPLQPIEQSSMAPVASEHAAIYSLSKPDDMKMVNQRHAQYVVTVMRDLHELCNTSGVSVSVPKFITLVNQALLLAASNNGQLEQADLEPLVALLKP